MNILFFLLLFIVSCDTLAMQQASPKIILEKHPQEASIIATIIAEKQEKEIRVIDTISKGYIWYKPVSNPCIKFHPLGTFLGIADGKEFLLWDIFSNTIATCQCFEQPIVDLQFNSRGDYVTLIFLHYLKIWNMAQERVVETRYNARL